MSGISSFEKTVLGLTAAFLLFTGGWFWAERRSAEPYEVTVQKPLPAVSSPVQPEQNNEIEEAVNAGQRPDSLLEGETIDLNTADSYDLQRLPGIGEKRALAIIAYREEHGPFQSVDELVGVKGIGEGILNGLREYAAVTPH